MLEPWAEISERLRRTHPKSQTDAVPTKNPKTQDVIKLSRIVFLTAGVYGLLVVLPQYALENRIGIDTPPSITHPEFFYGFIGVTTAWQIIFLIISKDPVRYRPMMLASVLEKISFVIPAIFLFRQ